jgi:hypothetical protein
MISTLEQTISQFEGLSDDEKARVLGRVSYDLTIAARDVCTEGDCQQQRDKLVSITEIQHRALAQMLAYQEGRKERYPDRELILILVERAKKSGLLGHLQHSIEKALSAFDQAAG